MKIAALFVSVVLAAMQLCTLSVEAQSRFHVATDIAKFRGDSSVVYVEVYFTFNVSTLAFVKKENTSTAEVIMDISFKRSADDSVVARQAWRIPFSTTDSTLLSTSRSYVDVLGFFLKPDVYRLYVVGKDRNNLTQRDSFSVPIDIKPIEKNHVALSDLELCTSIVPVEKDSVNRFIKNTYEVRPNPSRLFGEGQPVVFYYVEAYNLLKNKSPNYFTKATVTNAIGNEVVNHEMMKNRVNESNVEVGTVKVNTLRTGAYMFNFTVIDSVDDKSFTSSKKFFVYNPSLPMDSITTWTQGSVISSEYAAMNDAELQREIDMVRYISSRAEIAQFKTVTGVEAKRKLLFEFWNKRDEDPATPGNDQKTEYFKRVDYANEHFKAGFKEGWKTDRGRVFIVYGPPDEVERHASEVDTKPYEIWSYNSIQGGVQFIFGDRSGFSDYILLHSTHRDELHDDNWMQQLQVQ